MKNSCATFILTHEKLASTLRRTVEKIIGPQDHLYTFSNEEAELSILAETVVSHIAEIEADNVICFVDLVGGSCWRLAHMIKRELPRTYIAGGVNLPMLLSFFTADDSVPLEQRIIKAVDDAKRGIVHVKGEG